MAVELATPVDEFTGLPYPIVLNPEDVESITQEELTWHHAWHPHNHPLLQNLAGMALRNSRLELVPRSLHNHGPTSYHAFYGGPKNMPRHEADTCSRILLACAGALPEDGKGIDLSSGEPALVIMSKRQIQILRVFGDVKPLSDDNILNMIARRGWHNRPFEEVKSEVNHSQELLARHQFRYLAYRYDPVRDFLASYITEQDLRQDNDNETLIEQFMNTSDHEHKRKLGHILLKQAVKLAVEAHDVGLRYKLARRAKLLHPFASRQPSKIIMSKLGRQERREELVADIEAKLLQTAA